MRVCLPGSILLAVLGVAAFAASANAQPPDRLYIIDVKLMQTTPNGKDVPVYQPTVMTTEGQPAHVFVGSEITPPKDVEVKEPLEAGDSSLLTVFRKHGQLFLDASVNRYENAAPGAEGVRLTSIGLRVVEAVTLGKTITVPLPNQQKGHWELTVSRAESKFPSKFARPTSKTQ